MILLALPLLICAAVVHALGTQCAGPLGPGIASASDPYWMQTITRQGSSPFNPDPTSYQVYRNVRDFGAKGNGIDDDTEAINRAISVTFLGSSSIRCGNITCHSSTLSPAIVYFPPGNYLVSTPIIPYYYTSLVGDAKNLPVLIAKDTFVGIAVIDADVYILGGNGDEWFKPVNNFFKSVRNFKIDTTRMPPDAFGTGLHWQVGQATSLINVHVTMSKVPGNKHQGIFMENGSGGFMAQLSFDGGAFGMWISNQQFTVHDVTITNADTGIFQLWSWGFTFKNIAISNCRIGFDFATGGLTEALQSMGSAVILDSSIHVTSMALHTSTAQPSSLSGSIVLHNVDLSGSPQGLVDGSGIQVLAGQKIGEFVMGNVYSGINPSGKYMRTTQGAATIPASLLGSDGDVFFKTRPQYETYAVSQFVSVKALGAKGDGVSDDTGFIQAVLDQFAGCKIIFFDAGIYKVSGTIHVPNGAIIVGELYSTILAQGTAFQDASRPTPVLQVGQRNNAVKGVAQISDVVITTHGGSVGAIAIEWNLAGAAGDVGMWDVHVRIGGALGTGIQVSQCPAGGTTATSCQGAFLGFLIGSTGSGYFENVWVWTADHDLDDPSEQRINAFSPRGILVDHSVGPIWLVGTASEHHTLYQYSIVGASDVYMGMIQTETPYYQPMPPASAPFSINSVWNDPVVNGSAWALNVAQSSNIYIFGAGLYSFFVSLSESCKPTFNCQNSLALIDQSSPSVFIFGLNTIGATTMLTVGSVSAVSQANNRNGLQATMSLWKSTATSVNNTAPAGCPTCPGGVSGGQIFSIIEWNPNPHPSSNAASETFVKTGSTLVIPTPTQTVFATVGEEILILNAGGTPVDQLVPTDISQPSAVTPTWTFSIIPPTGATMVTFTAPTTGPPTYSSVVSVPSSSSLVTVAGPPGDTSCSGSNQWVLVSGPRIKGCLPADVGIIGGITPTPSPPVGWRGLWTNPLPPFAVSTVVPPSRLSTTVWNPNPFPNPTATSETFICAGTTSSLAIPTKTTSIAVGPETITLAPGGTPINAPIPTDCTLLNAITPIWTANIQPPPGAPTITFTAPLTETPTYISTVPVPSRSDSPPNTVIGPPGDKNRCNDLDLWTLLSGGIIGGCMPLDVGIVGGITPNPIPPPGWTGPWTNPDPLPTPNPDDPETSMTTSTSTTISACPTQSAVPYDLPGDPENDDWEDLGTDPDMRRRDLNNLYRRANPRSMGVRGCGTATATSPRFVSLKLADYFTVGEGPISTNLLRSGPRARPGSTVVQEHVFEIGYISQFFSDRPMNIYNCDWITRNVFNHIRADGTTLGSALLAAIDQTSNMVWADVAMNQAKSNVVNRDRATAGMPPQQRTMDRLVAAGTFSAPGAQENATKLEFFLRSFAALGPYLDMTSDIFKATALRVQNLLAEITPDEVLIKDASIPLIFNQWLESLLSTYPSGCISRAQNSWEYYKRTIVTVALNDPQSAQGCIFPLFLFNDYNPSSFDYLNLLPEAPNSARCNVPGTTGLLIFTPLGEDPIVPSFALQTIIGSGSTSFYSIGAQPGSSMTLENADTLSTGAVCFDMWWLNISGRLSTDPTSLTLSNIVSTCNGDGDQIARINYLDPSGKELQCAMADATFEDGTGRRDVLCSTAPRDIRILDCFPVFYEETVGSRLRTLVNFQFVDLGFVPQSIGL